MIRAFIVALLSPFVLATSPLLAAEYTVKIEYNHFTQTKFGNKKSYTSDRRTLELLTSLDRRFQGQTTWGKERLSAKGKLSEADDGMIELEIDCGFFQRIGVFAADRPGGPLQEIESKCYAITKIKLVPGEASSLGEMRNKGITETQDGLSENKEETSLRVTLIEEKPTE